ncbi:MAG: FUSC family protein [Pseudomonadota bacterium]
MTALRHLETLDPGGVRLYRGVQLVVAVALAAVVGQVVQDQLDAPSEPPMALNAAVITLKAMLFTLPGTRRAEVISALRLSAIMLGVYASAIVVGWGDLGLGPLPAQITWVGFIAAGFYLRRYGGAGTRCGLVLAISFMFVVVFEPTRQEALWWPLAVAIGCACAVLFYLVAWRPSPSRAFQRLHTRLMAEIAQALRNCVATHTDGFKRAPATDIRELWFAMARASDVATAAAPSDGHYLANLVASGLRMVLALDVVIEQTNKSPRAVLGEAAIRQSLEETADSLATGADDTAVVAAQEARLRQTRLDVLSRSDLEDAQKLQQVRILTALIRLMVSLGKSNVVAENQPAQSGATLSPGTEDMSKARRLAVRLTVQASISAALVVAVGTVFGLDQTFWAMLTIIVLISASWGATAHRFFQRVPGVLLGVLVAIGLQWLVGADPLLQGILIALAFAPVFALMDRHFGIASFLIGFALATGVSLVKGDTLIQMLALGYETAIGGAIGVVVAKLLLPIPSVDRLRPLLERLMNDGSQLVRLAIAGEGHSEPAAATLERDVMALADGLNDIGSERLLTRAGGPGTRDLQAHANALATYLPLFSEDVANLAGLGLAEAYRSPLVYTATRLSAALDSFPDAAAHDLDTGIKEEWEESIPLDGTLPVQQSVKLVEALFYARRCFETLAAMQHILVAFFPQQSRQRP